MTVAPGSAAGRPDPSRPIDLVAMGRVAVDLYAEQVGSPLERARSFRLYLGGCAGNVAVGSARLGLEVAMLSRVGSDAMGVFVRETLEREGVATELVQTDPQRLTGLVLLGVDPPHRFPLVFYREDCADMAVDIEGVASELEATFARAKALLVTGTGLSLEASRRATWRAVELAKAQGARVILDLDYRPVLWGLTAKGEGENRYVAAAQVSRELARLLPQVDVVVGTEEEVRIAGGDERLESALDDVRRRCPGLVVLKRGERGCSILAPAAPVVELTGTPVEVLNVLGAGDAFLAGFLRGFLRGEDLSACGAWANTNGALVVSRHGCAPAMASFAELEQALAAGTAESPRLRRLHRRAELGAAEELLLLAFDHRHQLETSCDEHGGERQRIHDFKAAVFAGFEQVARSLGLPGLGILLDPIYGRPFLDRAAASGVAVAVPIEASGAVPLSWIAAGSLYRQLLVRPGDWLVKVLWRIDATLSEAVQELQLERLAALAEVCDHLARRLIVEIVAADADPGSPPLSRIAAAMREAYARGVEPHWWKLPGSPSAAAWREITAVVDEHDSQAGLVVLGAGVPHDVLESWLRVAAAAPYASGFAVGRSLFWPAWERFARGKASENEVANEVAAAYRDLVEYWSRLDRNRSVA